MHRSSEMSLLLRFSNYSFVQKSHHLHACPALPIPFDFISLIICDEDCKLWSSSVYINLQPSVTSTFLGSNIQLNTLFSNIFHLCSSLNMTHQVSHQYKTESKTIVLNILYSVHFYIAGGKTNDSKQHCSKHFLNLFCFHFQIHGILICCHHYQIF
jgi:hypothetical protein